VPTGGRPAGGGGFVMANRGGSATDPKPAKAARAPAAAASNTGANTSANAQMAGAWGESAAPGSFAAEALASAEIGEAGDDESWMGLNGAGKQTGYLHARATRLISAAGFLGG
jgi:hypothetical protein